MTKSTLFLLMFLSMYFSTFAQGYDSAGYVIVKEKLEVIKKYLDNPNSDTTLKRVSVISFLTDLTGIASESDGNYIGQLSPTKNDYSLWERWLILNRMYIYWDKKSKSVVLYKKITPPKF